MASLTTTGTLTKALLPGVKEWFGLSYSERQAQWKDLFDSEKSDRAFEETAQIVSPGLAVVKSEASPVTYDSEAQGYINRVTHVTYGLGMQISEEAIADNQYMTLAKRHAKQLGFSMRQTKETLAALMYSKAFDAAYPQADGASLISASHPTRAGLQSNKNAISGDLSEATLEDLVILVNQAKNSAGLQIMLKPQSLIVPSGLVFEAARILKSVQQSGSDTNDINALKALNIFPGGAVVNNYLVEPESWFIRTDLPSAMVHYQRRELKIEDDNDFNSETVRFKATERYSFGSTDWLGLFGSNGLA